MSAGTVRITVAQAEGLRELDAFPTPVPCLVITEDTERTGHWIVTHQQSGTCVADVPDPEGALHVAVEFGALGDWTRTAGDLQRDTALMAAWSAVMEAGGLLDRYLDGPGPVPPEVLREIEARTGGAP